MLKRKLLAAAIMAITCSAHAKQPKNITLEQIGRYYETGVFESTAEIVAYDRVSEQLYVINANANTVDVVSIADPTSPQLVGKINVALDLPGSGGVNSVAVRNGLVSIAVENDDKQSPGWAVFYDTNGNYLHHHPAVTAWVHPDDFSSTNDENDSFDDRSGDEGPEPEGISVGKFKGREFAFVGSERVDGVMIFDVSDPANPRYVSYTNNRDFLLTQ